MLLILKDISDCENVLSKIRGFLKLKQKQIEHFFLQFLMLNISSIKELLHKPEKILWNITGTLPGKLKRKISWALSYKILPPEITKTWEIAVFGVLWRPQNQCGISWFFYDFMNFWKFQPLSSFG